MIYFTQGWTTYLVNLENGLHAKKQKRCSTGLLTNFACVPKTFSLMGQNKLEPTEHKAANHGTPKMTP